MGCTSTIDFVPSIVADRPCPVAVNPAPYFYRKFLPSTDPHTRRAFPPSKACGCRESEGFDGIGEQCIGISFSDFPIRPLGSPQAPDWPLCVQSNTPDGVAFPLPAVAHSCTSAQEGKRPFRAFPHTVLGSKKLKYPSGENRRSCVLPDCSRYKNLPGQTRQGFLQTTGFPL